MGFKKDFAWGAATAAYQIEGAYNEDGRGLSVWDVFTHESGHVFDDHTGDVACDHYHRYKDDIRLMRELGIKAYRFSLSWTRIMPEGRGHINEAGVRFYSDLVDELLKNGIEPYITLFHWDYPYELHKRGGWLNPDSVGWFADYAAVVAERLSDRVRNFITFNEPQCFIGLGYLNGEHAPGEKHTARDGLIMCHNVMKAHGAAIRAMRAAAKQDIRIGYAPTGTMPIPETEGERDIKAARDMMFACPDINNFVWSTAFWSDPVVLGRYPEGFMEKCGELMPEIMPGDMELISEPMDFYCQNIYQGIMVRAGEDGKAEVLPRIVGYAKSAMNWPVDPECMRWGPRFLYERYRLPVYITENGIASNDVVSQDGGVHDAARIEYIRCHLIELEKAADDGADIAGYFLWSLMDNFEWARGYSERFGMIYVDYPTQKRIIKDSGYWYRDRIEKNR